MRFKVKYLGRDKDLLSENNDKDLEIGPRGQVKDFLWGQQHWVTVKNGLLTDIYQ